MFRNIWAVAAVATKKKKKNNKNNYIYSSGNSGNSGNNSFIIYMIIIDNTIYELRSLYIINSKSSLSSFFVRESEYGVLPATTLLFFWHYL